MGFGLVSAALGASGVMNFFGARENRKAVQDTNYTNYKIWQEQKEYNSPVNQAKMLREAGLNPSLIMSGGGVGSYTAGTPPRMEAPQSEMSAVSDSVNQALNGYVKMKSLQNEINLGNAQVENVKQQNLNIRKQNELLNQDLVRKRLENVASRSELQLKGVKTSRSGRELENNYSGSGKIASIVNDSSGVARRIWTSSKKFWSPLVDYIDKKRTAAILERQAARERAFIQRKMYERYY